MCVFSCPEQLAAALLVADLLSWVGGSFCSLDESRFEFRRSRWVENWNRGGGERERSEQALLAGIDCKEAGMAERREVDEWVQEFEDAMKLAEEIMARIHQERSSYSASTGSTGSATDDHVSSNSSSDTDSNLQQMITSSSLHTAVQQRKLSHQVSMPSSTSSCRRKLSQLAHKLEHLESLLQQPNLKATMYANSNY